MSFFFKNKINEESNVKRILFNVGCLMDVPTARFDKGQKGESIMVGGLGPIFGTMGGPNTNKSTFTNDVMLTAVARISESGNDTFIDFKDTEQTAVPDRIYHLSSKQEAFKDRHIVAEGIVQITDAVDSTGDEWFKHLKKWLDENKVKNRKQATIQLPMLDYDGKPMEMLFPTFGVLDSLSEMTTDGVEAIEDKATISGSDGNMIFMRDGLAKQKLMMQLARVCNEADHFLLMTAHVGEKFDMATGPMAPKPTKDLPHMKQTEKAKNVPKKFYFLPTTLYQTVKVSHYNNQGTKFAEYPKHAIDDFSVNTDLTILTVNCVRSKVGPSGFTIDIVMSQKDGVIPYLTELDFLKSKNNYGLIRSGGGGSIIKCILLPDVSFTRNTAFEVFDKNPKLKRAINICAELAQMRIYHRDLIEHPEIEDIYEKLEKQYGWDKLLDTRGYWTLNQYDHPVPYLSCLDILKMYHDEYVPYWWEAKYGKLKKD